MINLQAIILAAGQGKRLNKLTKDIPKCMVEVDGLKIIDYQLIALNKNNIKKVIIVVGYKKDVLIRYLKSSKYNSMFTFTFIENEMFKTTNSCYSLWKAKEFISSGYIHLNSDLIFHPQLLSKQININCSSAIIAGKRHDDDDMVRVQLHKKLIKKIKKYNPDNKIDEMLVGPIVFNKEDSKALYKELELEIKSGILDNACYLLFDKILNRIELNFIYANELYWKEIDNSEDLNYANSLNLIK